MPLRTHFGLDLHRRKRGHEGIRVLQCTIREGNKESVGFFDRQGYAKVSRFLNRETGNTVGVWQKVLASPRREEGAEEKVE